MSSIKMTLDIAGAIIIEVLIFDENWACSFILISQ